MGSGRKILGGFLKRFGDHFSRSRLLDQENKDKAERERQKIEGWKDLQRMENDAATQKQRMGLIDKASEQRLTANNKRKEAIAEAKGELSNNISKFMSISPETLEEAGLNIHPDLKEALGNETDLDYSDTIETLMSAMQRQNPNLDELSAISSLNSHLGTELGKMEGYTEEQGKLAKEERDLKTFKEKEDYKAKLKLGEKAGEEKPASIKDIKDVMSHFNAVKGIGTFEDEPHIPVDGYTPEQAQQLIEYGKGKGVIISQADLPVKKPSRPGVPTKQDVLPPAKTPPGIIGNTLGTAGQMLAHPINSVKTAGRTLLGGGNQPQKPAMPPTQPSGNTLLNGRPPMQPKPAQPPMPAPAPQPPMAQKPAQGIDQNALKQPAEQAQQIIARLKAGDRQGAVADLQKLRKSNPQLYAQIKQLMQSQGY